MAGERFADPFYVSWTWRKCRAEFAKSKGGLCERCLRRGIINAGSPGRPLEVHHKIRLTPENIHDPSVTLNWDNLELLCKDCHEEERRRADRGQRWRIGADGRVEIREEGDGRAPLGAGRGGLSAGLDVPAKKSAGGAGGDFGREETADFSRQTACADNEGT